MKILSLLFSSTCFAFIPPVTTLVNDLFDGRKSNQFEISLEHTLIEEDNSNWPAEERIVYSHGKILDYWKLPNGVNAAAVWKNQIYEFSKDNKITSQTAVVLKYLLGRSGDEFLSLLVRENFVRSDQLNQYKQGFDPSGDPQTWDVKENYLRHSDIFLGRVGNTITFAVVGAADGQNQKSIHFDKSAKGIDRIEWKTGAQVVAWNFSNFNFYKAGGNYPTQMAFEVNGVPKITSRLLNWRGLNAKTFREFQSLWSSAAKVSQLDTSVQTHLAFLLGYR